jgi:hypothetical protein
VQATDQASVDLNKFRPPAADCAYVPTEGNGRGGAGVPSRGLRVIMVLSSSSPSLVKKKLGKKTIHYIIIISSAACDHIQVPWTPENTD